MKRAEELSLLFSHTRPDGTSCFSVNQDMVAEARKDTDDEEEKPDSVPAQKNKILRIGGAKYKVTTAAAKKSTLYEANKTQKSDPDPGIDQGQRYYVQGNFHSTEGF